MRTETNMKLRSQIAKVTNASSKKDMIACLVLLLGDISTSLAVIADALKEEKR